MANTFPDYTRFPKELTGMLELEEAASKLQAEFAKAFNSWLERCVQEWCPEAITLHASGKAFLAMDALRRNEFCYSCLPDGIYEFRQGETVLARCKIQLTIKSEL